MTSKQYIVSVLTSVFFIISTLVCINLYLNDFSLFWDRSEVRIWGEEKTSKYLLSYKYIPNNFEGILMGPSVSVNMDTKKIQGFKIYNLSMNSGNASELKYPVDNVLNSGKIKYLIICLYPYLTKDSGRKGRQIDEKEYWGSLYSILPIHILWRRMKIKLWPESDVFHNSNWGFYDTNMQKKNFIFNDFIEKYRKNPRREIHVDLKAYDELAEIVKLAHKKNVQVLAYYYPIYYEFIESYRQSRAWINYQQMMNELFTKKDLLWDMNLPEFDYITHEYTSYSDGHLSDVGAERVISVINSKLNLLK